MRKKNYTSPFCEVYPLNEEGALLGNTNNNNSTTNSNDSTQPPTLRVDNESGKEIENETISYKRVRGVLPCWITTLLCIITLRKTY